MSYEFFPKDNKVIRLQDAYIYLFILGTFGAHQFYLDNKRRAYYFLLTCGISHLVIFNLPFFMGFCDIRKTGKNEKWPDEYSIDEIS